MAVTAVPYQHRQAAAVKLTFVCAPPFYRHAFTVRHLQYLNDDGN